MIVDNINIVHLSGYIFQRFKPFICQCILLSLFHFSSVLCVSHFLLCFSSVRDFKKKILLPLKKNIFFNKNGSILTLSAWYCLRSLRCVYKRKKHEWKEEIMITYIAILVCLMLMNTQNTCTPKSIFYFVSMFGVFVGWWIRFFFFLLRHTKGVVFFFLCVRLFFFYPYWRRNFFLLLNLFNPFTFFYMRDFFSA